MSSPDEFTVDVVRWPDGTAHHRVWLPAAWYEECAAILARCLRTTVYAPGLVAGRPQ